MKRITALLMALIFILPTFACGKKYRDATIEFDQKNAKVIAHRGLSGIEVENTYSAFELAGKHSYYGIEADVKRTSDGKFIICHDDTLERIAGLEIKVEEQTFYDLMNLPIYDKYGKNSKGEKLTDLDSYIAICKQYDKQAILEFKSRFSNSEIDNIIQIIESHEYIERVTFISFNYEELLYVREKLPNHPVMYLFSKPSDEITAKLIRDKIDVGIKHTALTKALLKSYHDAGLKVNCWTVDSKLRANWLVKIGVDYITTNILE